MPTTAELVYHVLGEAHERLQARCEAVGRELRPLGVVAASRAADVTQRVTCLRVVF